MLKNVIYIKICSLDKLLKYKMQNKAEIVEFCKCFVCRVY